MNPLLINGYKFDLRIYVGITSFNPLRIYLFDEGFGRFATEPFTLDDSESKFAHLTNYSINKNNEKHNEEVKWTLARIKAHLKSEGIDTELLWNKIQDVVIKTILSVESIIVGGVDMFV